MEYKEKRKAISAKDFKYYESAVLKAYVVTYYTGCNKELIARVPDGLMRRTLLNPSVTQVDLNKLKKYIKEHEEGDLIIEMLEKELTRVKDNL